MGRRRFWPVWVIPSPSNRFRPGCAIYLAPAATHLGKMSSTRRIWVRCPRKISKPGWPIVKQNAQKNGHGGGGKGAQEKRKPADEVRTTDGVNRRTGERNRRYTCNSEYHYAPQCPQKENRYDGAPSPLRQVKRASSAPYSISMGAPLTVGPSDKSVPGGPERSHGKSFPTTLEIGGQFAISNSDSVVLLDTGATANLVCFKWLENRKIFLRKMGFPREFPYSTSARSKFGDGRAWGSETCSGYQGWRRRAQGRLHGVCAGFGYFCCIA